MKARDIVDDIKNWWDMIPGWHERIIWAAGGAGMALVVHALLAGKCSP